MFEYVKSLLTNPIIKVILVYMLYILCHFISTHAYAHFCTPFTIWGFGASPFIASTPHCKALRWTMHYTGIHIEFMWLVLGTWLAKIIISWTQER